jgi:phosphate/sulfate permease
MLGGLIGAAFSSPISIINVRLLGKLLGSWIASFLLGILFSYMLGVMLK